MDKLISSQALREAMYHEAMEKDSDEQKWDSGCWIRYKLFERVVDSMPSVQLTFYGYDVRHLELIALVLQKEGIPPERVSEVMNDISRIVSIVYEEFEKALRSAVDTSWYDFSNQNNEKEE